MKLFFRRTLLTSALLTTSALSAPLTLEERGQIDGMLSEDFEHLIYMPDRTLICAREALHFDWDTEVSTETRYRVPNDAGLNIVNMTKERADFPLDLVAHLIQRLFPVDLVPNQASMDDPVRALTTRMVGEVLEYICLKNAEDIDEEDLTQFIDERIHPGFYDSLKRESNATRVRWKTKTVSAKSDKNSDPRCRKRHLKYIPGTQEYHQAEKIFNANADAMLIDAPRTRWKTTRAGLAVRDFARTLAGALKDADALPELYPDHFVPRALYAFGKKKAERSESPFSSMLQMYRGMQRLLKREHLQQANIAFSREEAEETLKQMNEYQYSSSTGEPSNQKTTLSRREMQSVLGLWDAAGQIFPPAFSYGNTTYIDPTTGTKIKFSDCGESSLRYFLNVLLWNFDTRTFDLKRLERIKGVQSL